MHCFRVRSKCIIGRSTTTSIEIGLCLMPIHTQCGGRREDSPCSQCLGNDPQPFCSTKTLSMFNFLVLTGNLAPTLAILTTGNTDCFTKTISISRQNYTGKIPETDFCASLSQRSAILQRQAHVKSELCCRSRKSRSMP